eukprot:Gb_39540 [translate_table: standard]
MANINNVKAPKDWGHGGRAWDDATHKHVKFEFNPPLDVLAKISDAIGRGRLEFVTCETIFFPSVRKNRGRNDDLFFQVSPGERDRWKFGAFKRMLCQWM